MGKEHFCYELSITDHFNSAHWLDIPLSPCASLHGHTWVVRVNVLTSCCGKNGVSVDFRTLKIYLKQIINSLDHRNLNESLPFPPSAELIAKYICEGMAKDLNAIGVRVKSATVWEGEGTSVTYTAEDLP